MTVDLRLKGKVALITGIGSGIGRECALLYARNGALVVGCDIDAVSASATEELAAKDGLPVKSFSPCDLTIPANVEELVRFTVELYGGIDILVNAAAFGAFSWIQEMDYETQWRKTLVGELDVVFLACKAAWPHLIARGGGAIVNFASANARIALPLSPALAHCAGKGGVLAMTRQLAMEGAPHGIRANTVSPGLVETSATKFPLENIPGFRENVLNKTMLKRLGKPADIAWAAVYLGSDESQWVTGADLPVDGGATAW